MEYSPSHITSPLTDEEDGRARKEPPSLSECSFSDHFKVASKAPISFGLGSKIRFMVKKNSHPLLPFDAAEDDEDAVARSNSNSSSSSSQMPAPAKEVKKTAMNIQSIIEEETSQAQRLGSMATAVASGFETKMDSMGFVTAVSTHKVLAAPASPAREPARRSRSRSEERWAKRRRSCSPEPEDDAPPKMRKLPEDWKQCKQHQIDIVSKDLVKIKKLVGVEHAEQSQQKALMVLVDRAGGDDLESVMDPLSYEGEVGMRGQKSRSRWREDMLSSYSKTEFPLMGLRHTQTEPSLSWSVHPRFHPAMMLARKEGLLPDTQPFWQDFLSLDKSPSAVCHSAHQQADKHRQWFASENCFLQTSEQTSKFPAEQHSSEAEASSSVDSLSEQYDQIESSNSSSSSVSDSDSNSYSDSLLSGSGSDCSKNSEKKKRKSGKKGVKERRKVKKTNHTKEYLKDDLLAHIVTWEDPLKLADLSTEVKHRSPVKAHHRQDHNMSHQHTGLAENVRSPSPLPANVKAVAENAEHQTRRSHRRRLSRGPRTPSRSPPSAGFSRGGPRTPSPRSPLREARHWKSRSRRRSPSPDPDLRRQRHSSDTRSVRHRPSHSSPTGYRRDRRSSPLPHHRGRSRERRSPLRYRSPSPLRHHPSTMSPQMPPHMQQTISTHFGLAQVLPDSTVSLHCDDRFYPASDDAAAAAYFECPDGHPDLDPALRSPKRLSLDERLEKELGIKVRDEGELAHPDYSKPPPGYLPSGQRILHYATPSAVPALIPTVLPVVTPVATAPSVEESRLLRVGNMVQIIPEDSPPVSMAPVITRPTPNVLLVTTTEDQKARELLMKVEEMKKKKEAERQLRREKRLAEKQIAIASVVETPEAVVSPSKAIQQEAESSSSPAATGSLPKEEYETPAKEDNSLEKESVPKEPPKLEPDAEVKPPLAALRQEPEVRYISLKPLSRKERRRQQRALDEDEEEEDEAEFVPRSPVPLPDASTCKPILVQIGFALMQRQKKVLKYADGVLPGQGSPDHSKLEEQNSPEPSISEIRTKRRRRLRIRVIRIKYDSDTSDDDDDDDAPGPPPGEPPLWRSNQFIEMYGLKP